MRKTAAATLARITPTTWRALTIAAMIVLYTISVDNAAYELTTPGTLPHHVVFRKAYAMIAFVLVGFLFERSAFSRARGILWSAVAVGAFSALIEVGQKYISLSREPMSSHLFDVACGCIGGAIGSWIARALSAPAE